MIIESPELDILNKIRIYSKITFADFMETALYHPKGYYNSSNNISSQGDYFTSSVLHPSFAYLLTIQFRQMWKILGSPDEFWVIEMGSGTGHLGHEISKFANIICTDFAMSFRYLSLDRYVSDSKFTEDYESIEHILTNSIPLKNIVGCFISNELVDSFPVHRFKILDKKIYEIYVSIDNRGEIKEVIDEASSDAIIKQIEPYVNYLPDGFEGEVNLKIEDWIRTISKSLLKGFVLTIDYGDIRSELYSQFRSRGTLQTYYQHTNSNNLFTKIGKQDITAHVDFTSIIESGNLYGLKTLSYMLQSTYLNNLGIKKILYDLSKSDLSQYEYYKNRIAIMELVKPQGLGGFKVVLQEMNTNIVDSKDLFNFDYNEINFKSPILNSNYLDLADSRYSHQLDIKNFESYFI